MKSRLLIIIIGIIAIIASSIILIIVNHYERYTITELQEMCVDHEGKWDDTHNTCDKIDQLSCTLMNGEFQECKSREYRCPFDNPDCTVTLSCFSTCLFEQSLSANVELDQEELENEN